MVYIKHRPQESATDLSQTPNEDIFEKTLHVVRTAVIDLGPSLAASASMDKPIAKVGHIGDSITKNVGPPDDWQTT